MILIYEDEFYKNLFPLTYLHPVFELRVGLFSPLERILKFYPSSALTLLVREELEEVMRERYPNLNVIAQKREVSDLIKETSLFLSGRALLLEKIPPEGDDSLFLSQDGDLIGFRIKKGKASLPLKAEKVRAFSFKNLWDLIPLNEKLLPLDFPKGKIEGLLDKGVIILGDRKKLFVGKGAKVFPGNVLNLEKGFIYIDEEAEIFPFSYLEGPCYIGKRTKIFGAKIRQFANIGEECRIGGEIESSILMAFVNKYHEGFLGHSYIGEWVNLGAGTNNSDLKNNYTTVKIQIGRKRIDTGQLKLGCFIGDHVKTAIGTRIPAGAVIGIFANIVAEGFCPKSLPNFYWREGQRWEMEKAIATARGMMARRGKELTKGEESLIRYYAQLKG
uniref:Glucose-1-phosphate thymidylyltransferase n=1 Tax=candidate division WOR-3 bacterium TaxID=2052148 RepID=A0A7C3URU4_UNCW3